MRGPQRGWLRRRPWLAGVALLLTVGLVAAVVQAAAVRVFVVPSGTMRPTLERGDRVLVEVVSLPGRAPERGELVVVRRAGASEHQGMGGVVRSMGEGFGLVRADPDVAVLQRVIGLPGEIVEVRAGVVHVDGEPFSEPYATLSERDMAPTHLPPDHYWVVGDHRSAPGGGPGPGRSVDRGQITGRAVTVLWPPGRAFRKLHVTPEPAVRAGRQLPR